MGSKAIAFIPEVRERLISALTSGMSINDACSLAGIDRSTYFEWCKIGKSVKDGTAYKRKPKDTALQQEYADFVDTVKRAQAASRIRAIQGIVDAGRGHWIHKQTGRMIAEQPKPVTWMNKDTGETTFERPINTTAYDKQYSGDAWEYRAGSWQAFAWFAERSNRLDWGRTVTINVQHLDRLVEVAEKVGINVDELIEDLIAELQTAETDND